MFILLGMCVRVCVCVFCMFACVSVSACVCVGVWVCECSGVRVDGSLSTKIEFSSDHKAQCFVKADVIYNSLVIRPSITS